MAQSAGRNYSAGHYAINWGDGEVDLVKKISGAHVESEVITQTLASSMLPIKTIAGAKPTDMKFSVGMSMSGSLQNWIRSSLDLDFQRKDGTIIAADYNYKARSARDFFGGLITEVGFPALDASSKDSLYMDIGVRPEIVAYKDGDGSSIQAALNVDQKKFLASNFRVEIAGLDCSKVVKVDAIKMTQKVALDEIGDARQYAIEPTAMELSNLKLTIGAVSYKEWFTWFDDFVIKGNNGNDKEKNGSITFLSPNRQEELAKLEFEQIGIFKMAEDDAEANKDALKKFTVEMYFEKLIWTPGIVK